MGCGSSSASAKDSDNKQTDNTAEAKQPAAKKEPPQEKKELPKVKEEPPQEKKEPPQEKKEPPQEKKEPLQEKKEPPQNPTDKFVEDSVRKHNELRALHGCAPMKAATDLNEYSQKWADHLAKTDNMVHSDATLPSGGRIGENLYCCWSSDPTSGVKAEDAVQSWYDEIKDYDFNNGTFSMETGHFTQVVWKESVELGVAYAKSSGGTWYVVANYRPAGNMMGDFSNNVFPKQ